MAERYWNRLAWLAKTETTYGVDSTPTGAANAIDLSDVTLRTFEGQEDARNLMRPYLGNMGKVLTANHFRMEFSVEAAGSGTPGLAPAYGPLLRACRLAETVAAGVSVAYAPVSSGIYDAFSGWANLDGVNHRALGCRGNVAIEFAANRLPRFRFTVWGLIGAVEDLVLPALTYTAFRRAVEVNKANTTFSLHGLNNLVAETVSFDLANQVEPRFLIGKEAIVIPNRAPTGSATIEALPLATFDPQARALARTRGVAQVVHGNTAGNIITIRDAAAELGRPSYGQTQNIINQVIPWDACPVTGDDERTFTFT